MKTIYLIILIYSTTILFAQPILNSNDINFNTSANRFTASTTNFLIGGMGVNQTWDYSNIVLNSSGQVASSVVTTAPFVVNFANANYIVKTTISANDTYSFYAKTNSKLEISGISNTSTILVNFTPNPQTVFEFPLTYNSTINDSYATATLPSVNNFFSINYDAYGTLITPYATFFNTFRLKKLDGIYPNYTWYQENTNLAILNVVYGATGITSVTFYNNNNLDISKNENTELASIYPNPATNSIVINDRSKVNLPFNYVIFDAAGRILLNNYCYFNEIINIENLNNGTYFIEIKEEKNKTKKYKFIKN